MLAHVDLLRDAVADLLALGARPGLANLLFTVLSSVLVPDHLWNIDVFARLGNGEVRLEDELTHVAIHTFCCSAKLVLFRLLDSGANDKSRCHLS